MKYWLSWYQPTEDARPLTYPPNKSILGWWNSGSRCSDDAHTICALVDAQSEDAAKKAVTKDWPEAKEWRFCAESDGKLSDRFPLSDWMKERMTA